MWNVEISKKSFLQDGIHFFLVSRQNYEGDIGKELLILKNSNKKYKDDSLSHVAPFRVLNIGNTKKIYLMNFINVLEKELGIKAIKKYLPMQKGDVHSTLSDTNLLKRITGYNPKTKYQTGIKKFVEWYQNYYG